MPALTQNDEQVWDRLKEGAYCIIWLKTEEKSILRVLEVLEVVDGQQLIGWHYIHRAPGAFNPELSLAQRRLMPEWAHLRTQQRARPKRGTEDQYEKILGEYSFGEFMLVAAGFHMQSDGKVNGGRDLSPYIEGASSFGRVRPRSQGEPSHRQVAVGHLHRSPPECRGSPRVVAGCVHRVVVSVLRCSSWRWVGKGCSGIGRRRRRVVLR